MKNEVQDLGLRYGGRVVKVELYVNSDDDPNQLAQKCLRAARGLKRNAAMVMVSQLDGDKGREAWAILQQMAQKAAADPRSESFPIEDES